MRRILLTTLAFLAIAPAQARDVSIYAAASMTDVVNRLARAFENQTGLEVEASFASSSALARQVRRGAPADLVLTANRRWLNYLEDGNAIDGPSRRVIAANSLVLVAHADDAGHPEDLDEILGPGVRDLIAIGDPSHVPVGIYAKQSLETLGYWDSVRDRSVYAGSARATIAFVQRRAARYGIVYRTDALAFDEIEAVAGLPPESHRAIRYEIAVTFQGKALNPDAAYAFLEFASGPAAALVLAEYGFLPCPDAC